MSVQVYANLGGVEESATLGMTRLAAELKAADLPVISLSAGEPDFATPGFIAEAGIEAIRDGQTHYPPAAGLAPLRAEVAAYLSQECGGAYTPEQVLVTVGAKQALFNAIFTLFGPGNRIVIPAPYWVSYPPMARLARAVPVILETTAADGFKPDPDRVAALFRSGARGLVLNSPSNPSGAVLSGAELDRLVAIAAKYDAWIISDEIYHAIVYNTEHASVAARARDYERVVLVNGFSKAFAMTGWRVGYAVGPREVIAAMTRLQGHINTNTALPCQYAALAALSEREPRQRAIEEMVLAFNRRRDLLLKGVAAIPGLTPYPPDGAFYLWIDAGRWCDSLGANSTGLCMDLLDNERLALVPGEAFGADRFIRLSFAATEEALTEALERLADASVRLGLR
ncbi:MAG: pyridoxal phosphate-dependent aminotransferase [Gemmatimonadetes bacterium]|nr:pyridoxal phosphate-dependent aminotransferase [Gemmatimonadota bacterium]